MAERVTALEGDLADVPPLPDDLDAVVHCAGDVSFDPPVDEGFRTNVVGTRELLQRIRSAGGRTENAHYVHISTAYVAGRRRGRVPAGPVEHQVDLDAETTWGLAQRQSVEHRSRTAGVLEAQRKKAERTHSRAGLLTAARATEEARKEWVKDELVRLGTERARSLGWTDCYTFTKSLGERVVEADARTTAVSIVRPSIIESALVRPHPGWIEGFKMAEPLILAYGRGELPEFPASADTVVDIVPVDHVVAAIVAVLAHPPEPGTPAYFHVSSGDRNPLTFRNLYYDVRDYFEEHPFITGDRGAVRLPDWRFPGAQAVERLLSTSERAHKAADYVIGHAPRGDRTRDLVAQARPAGPAAGVPAPLPRPLPGVRPGRAALRRRHDPGALPVAVRRRTSEAFAFDTVGHRLGRLPPGHPLPGGHGADPQAGRAPAWPRKRPQRNVPRAGRSRASRRDRGVLRHGRHAAVLQRHRGLPLAPAPGAARAPSGSASSGRIAAKVPSMVQAERRDRSAFLRTVYREYAGARLAELEEIVDEHLTTHVLSRLSPDAVRRVREHRRAGHRTVLITGAIRPLTRPLAPLFDHIEAAELAVDDRGVCTGHLRLLAAGRASRGRPGSRVTPRRNGSTSRVVRLRRLALRPAPAGGGGQPGRGAARRPALPARAAQPLDDRRLGQPRRRRPPPQPREGAAHDARAGDVPLPAADRGRQDVGRPDCPSSAGWPTRSGW